MPLVALIDEQGSKQDGPQQPGGMRGTMLESREMAVQLPGGRLATLLAGMLHRERVSQCGENGRGWSRS